MVCSKCGKEVFEGVKYCPNCANPILENIYAQQSDSFNKIDSVMHTDVNLNQTFQQQASFNNNVMKNKKNNSWIYILCFVGLAVLICGIIIIFTDKPEPVEKDKLNSNSTINNYSSNNNDDNTIETINFKGYIFTIPTKYVTSISNKNQLQVLSNDKKEIYVYDIQSGSYDSLKRNQSNIKKEFERKGFEVGSTIVRTYDGIEFITVEVLNDEIDMLISYSKLSKTETFMAAVANSSYKIDYSLMNNVASILKQVTRA